MKQRGFTLVEIMVVIAIIAIAAVVAIPNIVSTQRRQEINNRTRELVSAIRFARGEAASGRVFEAAPVERQIFEAGIRFNTATQYEVFVDDDDVPGNEMVLRTVNLDSREAGFTGTGGGTSATIRSITIGATTQTPPAGLQLRFQRSGTLTAPVDVQIQLRDEQTLETRDITVTYSGQSRIL